MLFVDTYQWFWIDGSICVLTFIIQTLLFIIHLLTSLQSYNYINLNCFKSISKLDSTQQKTKRAATISTILALFFYFIFGLIVFVTTIDSLFGEMLHQHLSFNCNISLRIGSVAYQLSKGCIYSVFVLRLKLAFKGSKYEYSEKYINNILYVIIFYTLILFISNIFLVKGDKKYIYTPGEINSSFYICDTIIHMHLIIFMVLFDIIFTVICMYLFIKPLTKIIKQNTLHATRMVSARVSKDDHNVNKSEIDDCIITDEFRAIIIKYTIVTCVGLLSTFCGLIIIGITEAAAFSMIDVWINSICLILMCSEYDNIYRILCCGLLYCINSKDAIQKTFSKNEQKPADISVKNIEITINQSVNVQEKINTPLDKINDNGMIYVDYSDDNEQPNNVPVVADAIIGTPHSTDHSNVIINKKLSMAYSKSTSLAIVDDNSSSSKKKASLDANSQSASLMDDYHQQHEP